MKKEPFFILVIVCIITHIIRTIYEILKHKKMNHSYQTIFHHCTYQYGIVMDIMVCIVQP